MLVDVLDDSDVVARTIGIAQEIDSDAAVHLVDIAPEIDSDVAVSPVESPQKSIPMPLSVLWSLPERSMTRNSWSC